MPQDQNLLWSRREALLLLGAGAFGARTASAQQKLEFAALDHIEFYVSNVERSRDFFVPIFGNTLLRNVNLGKRYLKLGAAYMAFEARPEIRVDHFSAAIRNLEMPAVHAFLEARGVAYRDYPSGRDTAVTDADGIRTQLSPEDGWDILKPPNFVPEAVALAGEPVFRPKALDHILLNVADPEASVSFYEKIFGPVSERANNRIWFQVGASRVGLLRTPEAQRAGVHHFCVAVEPFDYDAATRRLAAMGAKVENPDVANAPEFRDPDGSLIQVITP